MSPCPGKCFPTGRIPRESDPCANAIPRAAAVCGSAENARSPITGLRGLLSTSRTGAKFTSIPTARSSAATAAPKASATDSFRQQKREQARAGGKCVNGASRNRATRPPSWSTAISGRGFPRPAAERISRHRARTWAGLSILREKSTTPPTCPSASHLDSDAGSVFPSKPTHRGEADALLPAFISAGVLRRIYDRQFAEVIPVEPTVPREDTVALGQGMGSDQKVRDYPLPLPSTRSIQAP